MYKFTFESQGTQTFLVYELKENEIIDSLGMGMMTNNDIVGLAPMLYTQLNNFRYFKYNISSKVSLEQFLTGTIQKKRILTVFSSITKALLALEEYMIGMDTVILEEERIYIDVTTSKALLINLPIINENEQSKDYLEFFKKIMYGAKFDQTENCNYVAKIINYLNSSTVLALQDFKKFIDNLLIEEPIIKSNMDKEQAAVTMAFQQELPVEEEEYKQESYTSLQAQVPNNNLTAKEEPFPAPPSKEKVKDTGGKKKRWSFFKSKNKKEDKDTKGRQDKMVHIPNQKLEPTIQVTEQSYQNSEAQPTIVPVPVSHGNFGETTVLNAAADSGETTVLSEELSPINEPYLVLMKNNEKIRLNKPVFRIGKEKSYVDYFIGDNTAVSRSHANIINRNGEYYVMDTNSTNHTYVNEKMIQSNREVRLSHGTRLRLANEEFEFKIH